MTEKTAKALDGMRRAVAKHYGIDESELQMTVNCRTEEVPDYFYDAEDLEPCAYGHDFTENLFDGGIVCETCGIKKSERELSDDEQEETCWDCGEWEICTCFDT